MGAYVSHPLSSFGIVLWEILTRLEPFQEFENFDEFRTAVCYQHRRYALCLCVSFGVVSAQV